MPSVGKHEVGRHEAELLYDVWHAKFGDAVAQVLITCHQMHVLISSCGCSLSAVDVVVSTGPLCAAAPAPSSAEQLPSLSLSGSHSSSTEGGILKIHVLSPIKKGKDKHGYDAILGSTGMSRLQLGINRETMCMYRKQTRPGFRKK